MTRPPCRPTIVFCSQFAGHRLILPTTEYLADRAAAKQQWDAVSGLYQVLADNGESPDYAAKGLAGLGKMQLKTGSAEDSAKTFETLLDRAPAGPQAAEAAYLRACSLESSDRWVQPGKPIVRSSIVFPPPPKRLRHCWLVLSCRQPAGEITPSAVAVGAIHTAIP